MATDTRHKHEKAGGAPDIVRRQSNHRRTARSLAGGTDDRSRSA